MSKKRAENPNSLRSFFDAPTSTDVNTRNSTILASAGTQRLGFTCTSQRRVDLHQEHYLSSQKLPAQNLGGFGRSHYDGNVYLPRNEDQKLIEQVKDEDGSGEIFVVEPEHYSIAGVVPPTTVKIKKPVVMNEYLMPPKQRLQVQRFQLRQKHVQKVARKAKNDTQRMVDIMRNQYRDGVIGFDKMSAANGAPAGRIYGDRIDKNNSQSQSRSKQVQQRMGVMSQRSNGHLQRGYNFMADDTNAPPAHKIGCSRSNKSKPTLDTHSRLFERKKYTWNQDRADRLGAIDNRGKSFNIVTGAAHHHGL